MTETGEVGAITGVSKYFGRRMCLCENPSKSDGTQSWLLGGGHQERPAPKWLRDWGTYSSVISHKGLERCVCRSAGPADPAPSCTAGGRPLYSGHGRTYRLHVGPRQAESTTNGEKWDPHADSGALPLDSHSESPPSTSDRRRAQFGDIWGSPTEPAKFLPRHLQDLTRVSADLIHRNMLNSRQSAERSPETEGRPEWQVLRQRGSKGNSREKTMHKIEENKIKTVSKI